jgi:excisionase family DNA binding protein
VPTRRRLLLGANGNPVSPWLTVAEAAQHAKCGTRSIYNAVQQERLRAARLGGRRELRFLAEWVDAWLLATATPMIVHANAPGAATREGVISGATTNGQTEFTAKPR